MRPLWRFAGYIDVEVQAPRRADREQIVQLALSRWSESRVPKIARTRVTNLAGGQWAVRFYV